MLQMAEPEVATAQGYQMVGNSNGVPITVTPGMIQVSSCIQYDAFTYAKRVT